MKLFVLILAVISIFNTGKPLSNAKVYLQRGAGKEIVAYQQTGDQGKVTFQHLNAGSYQLLVEFPQQEGKYIREKPKHTTLTKATFNARTGIYYYQGLEGYFSVKISGLKKMKEENFKAVFREKETEEGVQILIAQFQSDRNGAHVSVLVNVLTAAQFKKATDKIGGDLSTISIPGIK